MLNFTVGPVQMNKEIMEIGAHEIPYFRTKEFSALMLENEELILKFFKASEKAKVVFLTGSGTAAMEAAVMNSFDKNDKLIVINGGSFGQRFSDICEIYGIPHEDIKLSYGESLKEKHLMSYENKGFTGLLVNLHETSTGVLYDMELVSKFCKDNSLFLIVDCISAFLADEFDMDRLGVDIALTGSQKALALPPGVSVLVLNEKAVNRVCAKKIACMYLNLKAHLENMKRGQTPFTPAVGTLIQMNTRLKLIDKCGVECERERIAKIASDFRQKVVTFGFQFFAENMSNAVTALVVKEGQSAKRIFEILKDEYQIFVCPNGGELSEKVFRVGHIGNLTEEDNDTLISALTDMQKRGLL